MNPLRKVHTSVFVLLAFLAGTLVFSGCNQSQESQTPIEGLFGIKLGERLPPACAIEYDLGMIDGQINYTVIPPQTNAAFNKYWVTINPTNRLVCEIRADSSEASFFDVLGALRQKYGNESSKGKGNGFQAYTWWHGDRSLRLDSMAGSFHLSCTDNTLNHRVKPSADTNGF
jgi:hypothetical protein